MTAYYGPEWESLASRMIDRWCPSWTGNTGPQLPSTMGRNHGVLTNFANNGNDAYVASPDKLALDFDGVDDSVITDRTFLTFPNLSFWVQSGPQSLAGASIIRPFVSFGTIGFTNQGCYVGTNRETSTTIRWQVGQNAEKTIASTAVNNGNWHHFAVTISLGVAYLYFNGVQIDSQTPGAISGSVFRFGAEFSQNRYFDGQLDDITIFNTAPTDNEVRFIYEQGRGGGMLREPPKRRSFFVPTLPLPVRRRSSRFLTFPG